MAAGRTISGRDDAEGSPKPDRPPAARLRLVGGIDDAVPAMSPNPPFQDPSMAGSACVPAVWDSGWLQRGWGGECRQDRPPRLGPASSAEHGTAGACPAASRFRGKSRDTRMLVWAPMFAGAQGLREHKVCGSTRFAGAHGLREHTAFAEAARSSSIAASPASPACSRSDRQSRTTCLARAPLRTPGSHMPRNDLLGGLTLPCSASSPPRPASVGRPLHRLAHSAQAAAR